MKTNAPWSLAVAWDWMEECARSADTAVPGAQDVNELAEAVGLATREYSMLVETGVPLRALPG
jgi:hypothetical protein